VLGRECPLQPGVLLGDIGMCRQKVPDCQVGHHVSTAQLGDVDVEASRTLSGVSEEMQAGCLGVELEDIPERFTHQGCFVAALPIESTGSPVGLLPRCYLWQESKDMPVGQVPDLSGATRRSRTGDLLITNGAEAVRRRSRKGMKQ